MHEHEDLRGEIAVERPKPGRELASVLVVERPKEGEDERQRAVELLLYMQGIAGRLCLRSASERRAEAVVRRRNGAVGGGSLEFLKHGSSYRMRSRLVVRSA